MSHTEFLARALSGPVAWPDGQAAGPVVEAAIQHGIAGCLAQSGALTDWPEPARLPLLMQARAQGMWELRHKPVLVRLVAALKQKGIPSVLLKGTALAYSVYGVPQIRMRADSDLLVFEKDRSAVRGAFGQQGLTTAHEGEGTQQRQEGWTLCADDGSMHMIDLHWRLSNRPALAHILPEDEIRQHAVTLRRLSEDAQGLAPSHALVHAVLHRAGHRVAPYFVDGKIVPGEDRLIWLVDIDRLVRAMTGDDLTQIEALATNRGIGPLVAQTLEDTARLLATPLPPGLLSRLNVAESGPAMTYLSHDLTVRRVWTDLRAVPGVRGKAAFLRDKTFLPESVLRDRYPQYPTRPLVVLHLMRILQKLRGVR